MTAGRTAAKKARATLIKLSVFATVMLLVLAGLIVTNAQWAAKIRGVRALTGGILHPLSAYLIHRGLQTLPIRVRAQQAGAQAVAEWLAQHDGVQKVYYPGLETHPGHQVAAGQMTRFGGMVSFTVVGGQEEAVKICSRTRLFTLGESLGGVESLIEHPATMTHLSVNGSVLQVPDDLVRLSVGIEDADDLVADLLDALG